MAARGAIAEIVGLLADAHLPDRAWCWLGRRQPLHLVLAPRTVQLRPSRWKRIRSISTRGMLRASYAPRVCRSETFPTSRLTASVRTTRRRSRFLLRKDVYAETLLLTGGTAAFREGAKELFAVTKTGAPMPHRASHSRRLQLPRLPTHLQLGLGRAEYAQLGTIARGVLPTMGKITMVRQRLSSGPPSIRLDRQADVLDSPVTSFPA